MSNCDLVSLKTFLTNSPLPSHRYSSVYIQYINIVPCNHLLTQKNNVVC